MKSWTVQSSDGISHTIQYKKGFRNKLIVDGETYKLKSSNWCINLIDYSIDFEGAECRYSTSEAPLFLLVVTLSSAVFILMLFISCSASFRL